MQAKLGLLLVVSFLLAIVVSSTTFAGSSPTDLVISEVLFNATTSSESTKEWIEIKNKSTSSLSITTDFYLCDRNTCVQFPSSAIPSGEYYLIVRGTDTTDVEGEIGLTGTWDATRTINMNGSWNILNNDNDAVLIYNGNPGDDPLNPNSGATLMDCVGWGSGTPCSNAGGGTDSVPSTEEDGQSISKIGTDWGKSKQIPFQTYGGTPYLPNIWTDDTTSITLSSFGARSQQITAQPKHALATVSTLLMAALGVIGLVVTGVGIVVLQRRRTA